MHNIKIKKNWMEMIDEKKIIININKKMAYQL